MALERLHKVMAEAGVASRRHAEEMIAAGRVTVNGEVIREMGVKVDPERDRIEVDGTPLTPEAKVYLALNKPDGVVTTVDDPENRQTVLDLLPSSVGRVYPVGRLDMDSQGLLLLTNDGDLAYRLTHPGFEHEKEYKIRVAGHPSEKLLAELARGIELEDGPTLPAEISILQKKRDATWLRVVLREGRKRQLRRMFEAIEHPVRDLIRLRVGPIQLGDLPPGQWRHLSAREVQTLRRLAAGQDVDIVRPPSSSNRNAARAAGIAATGAAAGSRRGERPPRGNEGSVPGGRGRRINADASRPGDRPSRPGSRPAPPGRGRRDDDTARPGRPTPERRPRPDDDDDDWWMRDERPPRRSSGSSRPPASGGSPRPTGGGRSASSGGRPATDGKGRPTGGGAKPSGGSGRPSGSGRPASGSGSARPAGDGGRPPSGGGRPASGSGGRPPSGGGRPASGSGGRPPSGGSARPAGGGGRPASGSGGRPPSGGSARPAGGGRPSGSDRPPGAGRSRPASGSGSRRPASGSGSRPSTSRPPSRSGSKRGGPK